MPAITLQGNSLSERHHNLNIAVNEAYKNKLHIDDASSPAEATDVDNIFKIDLASKYRKIDYIIENLKSTDSLRVARALKASWLFTDDEFSHIINPTYINTTLSPLMSNKTLKKLMYQITYHLDDEKRCEEFYLFYQKRCDKLYMKKLLLKSSIIFIKEQIAMKDFDVTPQYLASLSFRSWEIVAAYIEMQDDKKISSQYIFRLKHLLNANGDFYLDLVENCIQVSSTYGCNDFHLGQRATREIVRNHKLRIFAKPYFYLKLLHFDHLARALTEDDIRNLAILITSHNDFWNNDHLISLLNKLPFKNRYDFTKTLYEKYHPDEPFEMNSEFATNMWYNYMSVQQKEEWALEHVARMDEDLGQVFQWYQFIDYKTTFIELKKLLQSETNACYREQMFVILVSTCTDEESDVFELLKYFHDRHINEIMSFKINIIQRIIQSKKVYRCGEKVWNILNEIFLNMRIYESVNECSREFIEKAAAQILTYHLINDKLIADNIFKLFGDHYSRLNMMVNTKWKEKIFDFVYKWNLQKTEGKDLTKPESLEYMKSKTNELIRVTVLYGYEPKPEVFSMISRIREHDPKFYPTYDYKDMFKEFLAKGPVLPKLDENVGLRLLKKDIKLLDAYKTQFDDSIKNNLMRYRKLLTKIRIYFTNDFARDWTKYLLSKFEGNRKDSKGCACVVFGLSVLLPAGEYEQLIKQYRPEKARLVWSETDPCLVHIQNNIGHFMYLVRPTVNIDYLMSFARGDFLQYTIQSLASVSTQLPREECRIFVTKLLDGRISVQKHGIHMASTKYTKFELVEIFRNMWGKTANVSIQKMLFKHIHHMLTQADSDELRLEVWKLLREVLRQLHGNEQVVHIMTMTDSEKIGISVKPQYCIEYWHLLQTAPNVFQAWTYKSENISEMAQDDLINHFDEEFLKEIIINFLNNQFAKPTTENEKFSSWYKDSVWTLISQFLVHCETREMAEQRKDILKITIGYFFSDWAVIDTKNIFQQILKLLLRSSQSVLHVDKGEVFNPVYIFEYIYGEMNKLFPIQDYYEHHLWLRLAMIFINSLYESRAQKPACFEVQFRIWAEIFGKRIKEFMNVEITKNYPLLPQLFHHYCLKFLDSELNFYYLQNKESFYNSICKTLINEDADIYSYNLAVECLVKVYSSRAISDTDKREADSLMDTLRRINIPYFNHFIDTRVKPYSLVFY